jgi:transposase
LSLDPETARAAATTSASNGNAFCRIVAVRHVWPTLMSNGALALTLRSYCPTQCIVLVSWLWLLPRDQCSSQFLSNTWWKRWSPRRLRLTRCQPRPVPICRAWRKPLGC